MSNSNPNFNGAVNLGGREYRISLNRETDNKLKIIAKANGATALSAAEWLLTTAVQEGFNQLLFSVFLEKTNALLWGWR